MKTLLKETPPATPGGKERLDTILSSKILRPTCLTTTAKFDYDVFA
jgi:hypothetical protein